MIGTVLNERYRIYVELGRALYQRSLQRGTLGQTGTAQVDARRALSLFEGCGAQDDAQEARGFLGT